MLTRWKRTLVASRRQVAEGGPRGGEKMWRTRGVCPWSGNFSSSGSSVQGSGEKHRRRTGQPVRRGEDPAHHTYNQRRNRPSPGAVAPSS
jgi:hypothetical protein